MDIQRKGEGGKMLHFIFPQELFLNENTMEENLDNFQVYRIPF